ncbi:ribitol-5-phosphate dehydrogenase [Anaeromicropila herbilytica]|uniref:Ribulose-5-phosphate reductase n=1 Tax=Anaeromicropila herbilytica TaxID=2785025 RepID=A0A7R7EIG8_9FIRM|nr:ribitol-5-phosphate dehydrogenase [Anaeromicropila herbilytica]BCN29785.1 zinc-binding dehydrogenase [Anaeromicropila herbilytica]
MLNTVYRLVAPRRIEIAFTDIDLFGEDVIVRPTHLSVCNADQRYFQGTRDPEVLAKKLPMALIHEGIGEVICDPTNTFKPGDSVVMIPNTPVESDEFIAENYLRSSKFRASGYDGFLQEFVAIKPDRLVSLPDDINKYVASFTEIVSVSVHAISRFERFSHARRDKIGVWGDGNLGFITSLFLKTMFPDSEVYVFGIDEEKLNYFSFADKCYVTTKIPKDLELDHAFECVGGNGSQIAINQIIDYIKPEGTISILGVSEYPVPINTRMVLEKGLRIFGSSRSGREDFVKTVELYKSHPEIVEYLESLVGFKKEVRNVADISIAFEEDIKKAFGKTIMKWVK